MKTQLINTLARRWTALGAMFNVPPAPGTPDLEILLLDTTRLADASAPQFVMAITWLATYGDLVARHRLARLIGESLAAEDQPALGLLLESAVQFAPRLESRFHAALQACAPARVPMPLLEIDRRNDALRKLSEREATPVSRRWGRWLGPVEVKSDALRPPEWLARRHPQLALRALVGGDLVASILAEAAADPHPFKSEVELARRCGASRPAIRDALAKLKLAGLATMESIGRRNEIRIRLAAP